uniref:Calcineurin-like phosphoesterase domain-containing protein n=1 Tax=Globisporangium ultimum (strain ATCC 200006 / CBS 805.95 / DAOM BR144) TaxID=431595 RepID=K3WF96_GLOUD
MRVVCISDTHGLHDALHAVERIPDGDVLIHAGDFTDTGDRDEVLAFNEFLGKLPHKYKLVIAGNHESTFDRAFYPFNWQQYGHSQQYDPDEVRALLTNGLYLEDQAVLIEGFKFYGTPWQPEFCNWAFNLPRGEKLREKWQRIPNDTDVLITHTPPYGRGDRVGYMHVGCEELSREVTERIRPKFHVFGHVHEGYGSSFDSTTTYMNASACTHDYDAINPAFVFELTVAKAAAEGADASNSSSTGIDKQSCEYAKLLHEQLRVCSQKAPFVPIESNDSSDASAKPRRPQSLREFRIDGTTSAMLLESTLKLRPVVGEQTRALRYLFHNGFAGKAAMAATSGLNGTTKQSEGGNGTKNGDDSLESPQLSNGAAPASAMTAAQRRQSTLMRRVTMAVLNDVSDSKELTDAAIEVLESSASTIANGKAAPLEGAKKPVRVRRSKTLQRRDGRARLASMAEEPDETAEDTKPASLSEPPRAASLAPAEAPASAIKIQETVVVSPPPAPVVAAVECVLCKYKVPGHVHPGAVAPPVAPVTVVQATAVVEVKQSSISTVESKNDEEEIKEKAETERQKTMSSSKRLSSWF